VDRREVNVKIQTHTGTTSIDPKRQTSTKNADIQKRRRSILRTHLGCTTFSFIWRYKSSPATSPDVSKQTSSQNCEHANAIPRQLLI